jgi:hypothetical protein
LLHFLLGAPLWAQRRIGLRGCDTWLPRKFPKPVPGQEAELRG